MSPHKTPELIQTFNVSPRDGHVKHYNTTLESQVRQALQQSNPRVEWTSFTLFRRGPHDDASKNPFTLVITTPDLSQPGWENLKSQLKPHCAHPEFPVELEILETNFSRMRELAVPYNNPPQLGESLGVMVDENSSGTLGAYLNIQMDGKKTISCGLTCDHVVHPGNYGDQGNGGSGPNVVEKMVRPSNADQDDTVKVWEEKVKDLPTVETQYQTDEANLVAMRDDVEEPALNRFNILLGWARRGDRRELNREKQNPVWQTGDYALVLKQADVLCNSAATRDMLLGYQATLDDLETFTVDAREWGTVMLWSGNTTVVDITDTECRIVMDWALIQNTGVMGVNMSENFTTAKFEKYKPKSGTSTLLPVRDYGSLTGGLIVVKNGRTTGATVGEVNAVRSTFKAAGPHKDQITQEWTISHYPLKASGMFADHGDSGSAVLDESGNLVGLLWGGNVGSTGSGYGTNYVTNIFNVTENMKGKDGVTGVFLS